MLALSSSSSFSSPTMSASFTSSSTSIRTPVDVYPSSGHGGPNHFTKERQRSIHDWQRRVNNSGVAVPPSHPTSPAPVENPSTRCVVPRSVLTDIKDTLDEDHHRLHPDAPPFLSYKEVEHKIRSANSPTLNKDWERHFFEGTHASSSNPQLLHTHSAAILVALDFNVEEDIPRLAEKCVHRVAFRKFDYERGRRTPPSIAPFIVEIRRNIYAIFGPMAAEAFRIEVMEQAMASFASCWLRMLPKAILTGNPEPLLFTVAGTSLGAFVGDLHVLGFLDGSNVMRCLGILLDSMQHMEHLQAIHTIVERTNGAYWGDGTGRLLPLQHVEEFLYKFLRGARSIPPQTVPTGQQYPESVGKRWIAEVESKVRKRYAADLQITTPAQL
ncbi:hypothetical protein EDD18DRAFT_1456831 [Armillaria luteobubalina]|uniref:Uncharacterized protein n=1 Tax=Armillaria luteobubalina TaxID=153913 RepID=A0AA39QL33_9AGAR|nr:hypothetical protein EDD18DRAFT_1456831 [Armillaria luteobubalina]